MLVIQGLSRSLSDSILTVINWVEKLNYNYLKLHEGIRSNFQMSVQPAIDLKRTKVKDRHQGETKGEGHKITSASSSSCWLPESTSPCCDNIGRWETHRSTKAIDQSNVTTCTCLNNKERKHRGGHIVYAVPPYWWEEVRKKSWFK